MKNILSFILFVLICAWLIAVAIDNMPPSQAELSGQVKMGPVNPAYTGR